MENRKKIDSRLGEMSVDITKEIFFPQGLIGFEDFKRFTLVEFHKETPFLLLQSMEEASFGLVVTDPLLFLPDYQPQITPVERRILGKNVSDLLVLVSITIPTGQPEQTTLNLFGPILIDNEKKIALQSPQNDCPFGGRVLLSEVGGKVKNKKQ